MIVALDIGLKRIGVAVCVGADIVLPSEPIMRTSRNQAARDVAAMLAQKNATKLIVGLPKGGSSEDEMNRRIKHFISLVDTSLEPIYIDESFSSFEASFKATQKASKSHKNGQLDSLAACEILKRYLRGANEL